MNSRSVEIWELSIRESVRQTLADYTAGSDGNRGRPGRAAEAIPDSLMRG